MIDEGHQPDRVRLAGISITSTSLHGATALCRGRVRNRLGGYVCFVNAHSLTESTSDLVLREALVHATFCFPDGMPLVWLARAKGTPLQGRVCGPDLMERLLREEPHITHGFIGGVPGCGEAIAQEYGVTSVVYSPPVRAFSEEGAREDWTTFLARWTEPDPPQIVWVGLGAPKQERWLEVVSPLARNTLFLGVGAAFDFLSLAKRRAPLFIRRLGLEWAHRLASEPKRLWKRYLVSNSRFTSMAIRELIEQNRRG